MQFIGDRCKVGHTPPLAPPSTCTWGLPVQSWLPVKEWRTDRTLIYYMHSSIQHVVVFRDHCHYYYYYRPCLSLGFVSCSGEISRSIQHPPMYIFQVGPFIHGSDLISQHLALRKTHGRPFVTVPGE